MAPIKISADAMHTVLQNYTGAEVPVDAPGAATCDLLARLANTPTVGDLFARCDKLYARYIALEYPCEAITTDGMHDIRCEIGRHLSSIRILFEEGALIAVQLLTHSRRFRDLIMCSSREDTDIPFVGYSEDLAHKRWQDITRDIGLFHLSQAAEFQTAGLLRGYNFATTPVPPTYPGSQQSFPYASQAVGRFLRANDGAQHLEVPILQAGFAGTAGLQIICNPTTPVDGVNDIVATVWAVAGFVSHEPTAQGILGVTPGAALTLPLAVVLALSMLDTYVVDLQRTDDYTIPRLPIYVSQANDFHVREVGHVGTERDVAVTEDEDENHYYDPLGDDDDYDDEYTEDEEPEPAF